MEPAYALESHEYPLFVHVRKEQVADRLQPTDDELKRFNDRLIKIIQNMGYDNVLVGGGVGTLLGDFSSSVLQNSDYNQFVRGCFVRLYTDKSDTTNKILVPYNDPADWSGIERVIKDEVEKLKKSRTKTASDDEPQVFEDDLDFRSSTNNARRQMVKRNISNRLNLDKAEGQDECDRVEAIVKPIAPFARVHVAYSFTDPWYATSVYFVYRIGLLVEYEASADKIRSAVEASVKKLEGWYKDSVTNLTKKIKDAVEGVDNVDFGEMNDSRWWEQKHRNITVISGRHKIDLKINASGLFDDPDHKNDVKTKIELAIIKKIKKAVARKLVAARRIGLALTLVAEMNDAVIETNNQDIYSELKKLNREQISDRLTATPTELNEFNKKVTEAVLRDKKTDGLLLRTRLYGFQSSKFSEGRAVVVCVYVDDDLSDYYEEEHDIAIVPFNPEPDLAKIKEGVKNAIMKFKSKIYGDANQE